MIQAISICRYNLIIIFSSSSPLLHFTLPLSLSLSLSLSLCLCSLSLRCSPNYFFQLSVCYLLFNNHVSRMCVHIHRQFSAVVIGKSITPLTVCVCVCVCVCVREREDGKLAAIYYLEQWLKADKQLALNCVNVYIVCVCARICQCLITMFG